MINESPVIRHGKTDGSNTIHRYIFINTDKNQSNKVIFDIFTTMTRLSERNKSVRSLNRKNGHQNQNQGASEQDLKINLRWNDHFN